MYVEIEYVLVIKVWHTTVTFFVGMSKLVQIECVCIKEQLLEQSPVAQGLFLFLFKSYPWQCLRNHTWSQGLKPSLIKYKASVLSTIHTICLAPPNLHLRVSNKSQNICFVSCLSIRKLIQEELIIFSLMLNPTVCLDIVFE